MMGIYLYGIEMAEEYPIPFFKNPVRLFYFNPYPALHSWEFPWLRVCM